MTTTKIRRRIMALKTADAINAIEGVPVSQYAQVLSQSWARGDIAGEQMKQARSSAITYETCCTGTKTWLIHIVTMMFLFCGIP